jgi:hypothetical protein
VFIPINRNAPELAKKARRNPMMRITRQAGTSYHGRENGTYGYEYSEPCGLLQFPAELLRCILEYEAFAGESHSFEEKGEQTEAGCWVGEKPRDSLR